MTYKKIPQVKVFERWRRLNPTYKIDFSLDKHCILFIKDNFSVELAKLFIDIPIGMYKADLWRLCKLYIQGGVYADIDLVPYVSIDSLLNGSSFYSCIGIDNKSIFQALIITTPKNPLILSMLMSLIQNRPFYKDGPTTDMYNCLKFNINKNYLDTEETYNIDKVKIPIILNNNTINLYKFPNNWKYKIMYDNSQATIINNKLKVQRIINKLLIIEVEQPQSIYLFKEIIPKNSINCSSCYVIHKNIKIFDSRDKEYYYNKINKII